MRRGEEMDVSDILFILTSLVPVLVRRDVTRKLLVVLVVASRCVINILSLSLSLSSLLLSGNHYELHTLVNRAHHSF